jgi:GNAT superfamily N-acetyltransferase
VNTQRLIRVAQVADIPQIQLVRNAVKENQLSDPSLVTDADVEDYIINRGRGWVSEVNGIVTGFSIVSIIDKNVWALFIQPGFDRQGTGRLLHDVMMDWYFSNTTETVWLSTTPDTRAEKFYRKAGWIEVGKYGKEEIKFEMTAKEWEKNKPGIAKFTNKH